MKTKWVPLGKQSARETSPSCLSSDAINHPFRSSACPDVLRFTPSTWHGCLPPLLLPRCLDSSAPPLPVCPSVCLPLLFQAQPSPSPYPSARLWSVAGPVLFLKATKVVNEAPSARRTDLAQQNLLPMPKKNPSRRRQRPSLRHWIGVLVNYTSIIWAHLGSSSTHEGSNNSWISSRTPLQHWPSWRTSA